jgi:transposase
MISAVATTGELHFKLIDGRMNSQTFITFCADLLHDARTPVLLILDGASYHHSRAVNRYIAEVNKDGLRLRIYRLPAYSPQLNPDEWVWRLRLLGDPHPGGVSVIPARCTRRRSTSTTNRTYNRGV